MSRRKPARVLPRAFLALHLLLVAVPILVMVMWSFTASWPWPSLIPEAFSLKGYAEVFGGANGAAVLAQSVGIALATAVLTTAVAALGSRALARYQFRGKELFRFATVLPFLIPTTVFAMGVQVVFLKMGFARTVGGVILAHSIVALPYAVTIMADVTAAAGGRLEEAARSLGARPLQNLVHVILPQLAPGILSSISMSYILSFSQYFLTLLIGGGMVKTFALEMFPYLTGGDRTIASAYGVVFLVVTFAVFLLVEWALKKFGFRAGQDLFNLQ